MHIVSIALTPEMVSTISALNKTTGIIALLIEVSGVLEAMPKP